MVLVKVVLYNPETGKDPVIHEFELGDYDKIAYCFTEHPELAAVMDEVVTFSDGSFAVNRLNLTKLPNEVTK
jgi:hypothetical protein